MQPLTFIFYGYSGSGKGTQAKLLREYLETLPGARSALHLTTGRRFREFAKGESYTAERARDVIDAGGLMPAFMPIWIWTGWLIENFTGDEHLIFDGLARRPDEAPILEEALKFYNLPSLNIVFLNVSRTWATDRLRERGRADDTDENITKRLDWFEGDVRSAMEYFKGSDYATFHDIDGEAGIPEVHERIKKAVGI